ncbi:MAG: glycosyltransferase family 39 protein [Acidimicrobiales bacterium]|nr:glycosyltransferase family 39 protein [Acidimicrobiales bacterium]
MPSVEPRMSDPTRPGRRVELGLGALVVLAGVVLRFVTDSPLWLDEALSVTIAQLPAGDIPEALRHDGHPPLYYLLLHGWMELFGSGDVAVRSLSGILGVALLPLMWVAGRRRGGVVAGGAALVLAAATPYLVRYSTEARMYALLALLVLGAWLVADDLRGGPDRGRWALLAVLTGGALLTHYWAIYLGVAAVGLLAWRWWRADARREALRIGSALAAGTVFFLPWLPSFLYQASHTGTPWGTATRPTRAVTELANGLGGQLGLPEAMLFGFFVLGLAALGLVLASASGTELTLDLRTVPVVRPEIGLVLLTILVGLGVGAITNATFVARYAAGFVPMLLVAAGVAVAGLPGVAAPRVAMLVALVLAGPGLVYNVIDERTQGARIASAITAQGDPDDLVVFCPDQLGPSTLRALPASFEAVGVPALTRPERIDWVDYAARNQAAQPEAMATEVLERAGDHTIWLVYAATYRTYEGLCEGVLSSLSTARPDNEIVVPMDSDVFESATLVRLEP